MSVDVKICGINSAAALTAAVTGGASMVGFVFFPASPRCVTPFEAMALMKTVPQGILRVGLFVDPNDADVGAVCRRLPVDLVQLHGTESPERVLEIKKITGLPVMKAIGIHDTDDIKLAHTYEAVSDRILLDAKAPKEATLPGGNAISFDWTLINPDAWTRPWMLAGGLNVENLAQAVSITGACMVDVSSGVEDVPGHKSPHKITEFLNKAASLKASKRW